MYKGACVFKAPRSLSTCCKLPGLARAHVEPLIKEARHQQLYCMKGQQSKAEWEKEHENGPNWGKNADFWEYGTLPEPGKRNDLHEVIEKLKTGKTLKEVVQEGDVSNIAAIVRYERGLESVSNMMVRDRTKPPIVWWISGPTGIGKTRCCRKLGETYAGSMSQVWKSASTFEWFPSYRGQKVAIIDDFRARWVNGKGKNPGFDFILNLLDEYPMEVPVKNGFKNWVPELIFITCPKTPVDCFKDRAKFVPEDIGQLTRRIHKTYDYQQRITPYAYTQMHGELAKCRGVQDVGEDNGNPDTGGSDLEELASVEEVLDEDVEVIDLEQMDARELQPDGENGENRYCIHGLNRFFCKHCGI